MNILAFDDGHIAHVAIADGLNNARVADECFPGLRIAVLELAEVLQHQLQAHAEARPGGQPDIKLVVVLRSSLIKKWLFLNECT